MAAAEKGEVASGVISPRFRFLHRIYVAVFRQYPVLGPMAVVAIVAEILFASGGLALCVITPTVICTVPLDVFLATPVLILLVLVPLRALDGVGAAALWPPLFAGVPDHVPREQRGVAMNVVNTSYLAGLALGPALAGVAMKVWRAQGAGQGASRGLLSDAET